MAANDPFMGRRVSVGFGVETTPGTSVAPGTWFKHMTLDFQRRQTSIRNESALGRVEKFNDSAVVATWADGKFEGKVGDQTIGYILQNIFGTAVTTTNPDASTTVKNHTFDVDSLNIPPALTVVRKDPKTNRRHALGFISDVTIKIDNGGWGMVSGTITTKSGTTGTDTVTYPVENEFTSKHIVLKLAANAAGLGAAQAIDIKSVTIKLMRPVNPYIPFGATEPTEMELGEWEFEAEAVIRYRNTTYEDLWFANTIQAMSITATNTDVVIGTSANPSLAFTAPRVRLDTFGMSTDLGKYTEQTVGITGELDLTAGYLVRALLTNTKTGYTT